MSTHLTRQTKPSFHSSIYINKFGSVGGLELFLDVAGMIKNLVLLWNVFINNFPLLCYEKLKLYWFFSHHFPRILWRWQQSLLIFFLYLRRWTMRSGRFLGSILWENCWVFFGVSSPETQQRLYSRWNNKSHITRPSRFHLVPFFSILGRILLFYVIFYVALAAFAAGLFFLFDLTLKDERPKYVLEESLIGVNPGLGFRPMPPESSVESTLVWFKNDSKNIEYWVGAIDEFLKRKLDLNDTKFEEFVNKFQFFLQHLRSQTLKQQKLTA